MVAVSPSRTGFEARDAVRARDIRTPKTGHRRGHSGALEIAVGTAETRFGTAASTSPETATPKTPERAPPTNDQKLVGPT